MTLLKAIPLAAALFLLFPAPVRTVVGHAGRSERGSTGLSNSMSPGSISRLLESDEIAFRARFEGTPPAHDRLYWRGPVFGTFNGRTWSPIVRAPNEAPPLNIEADPTLGRSAYEVTLEPHKRDWLFALEAPAALPKLDAMQTRLTPEMQLLAGGLDPGTHPLRDALPHRFPTRCPGSTPPNLHDWVELPAGYNPRTLQFAEELRSRVRRDSTDSPTRDTQLVNAVLDHLRRGGYSYTLTPPALGRNSVDEFLFDTRQGFCEHYSSAFVFLMRALAVPARVVTGYQGGELNPVDGFMTVRQSDAHAWTEVWLPGRGWVRVDPTAVVAPIRIDRGAGGAARPGAGRAAGAGRRMPRGCVRCASTGKQYRTAGTSGCSRIRRNGNSR